MNSSIHFGRTRSHAFSRNQVQLAVLALGLSCALQSNLAVAQIAAPSGPTLNEVTVTGNPLGSDDLIAPATTLSGNKLVLRRATT